MKIILVFDLFSDSSNIHGAFSAEENSRCPVAAKCQILS